LSTLVSDVSRDTMSALCGMGLNVVEYAYNRQGETIQMDANGTQYDYTVDGLGRQVSDTVATLGTGIDGTVRRIDTAFNYQGNVSLTTSFSTTSGGSENIVNQVADAYGGFGLLTEEQQSVSGAVTSTTPAVYYSYSTDSATPTELVGMTYPNGRELTYGYSSGTDAAIGDYNLPASGICNSSGNSLCPTGTKNAAI
jgi:hypothetical protein